MLAEHYAALVGLAQLKLDGDLAMAYVNKAREGREFWNRLCTLPRYMFLLMPSGKGVQKLEDRCGNWIDVHDAQKIVDDAQTELAALQEELESMRDRKNSIVDLQQRLTAAEQRNAEYVKLLHQAKQFTEDLLWPQRLRDRIDAVISHSESGSGEEKCSDCFGTGHAHSNGMCVDGTCDTCKGTGHE